MVEVFDCRDESLLARAEPVEELLTIPISEAEPTRIVQLGALLSSQRHEEILNFLGENSDIFAWKASDMPGISRTVAEHSLDVNPSFRPVQQKRQNFVTERNTIINEEVDKLLAARFVRNVKYPTWLANVVMVPKCNGKWRICVDYSDLNKACPKDCYPLPRIDSLIDSTAGHEMLTFMDIGRNMEVYIDDMLVKSNKGTDHVLDLKEAFGVLRKNQMRLNPIKCAFGVTSGKFLGFLVSQRGIEPNPSKIEAIHEMRAPRNIRQVQKLTGCLAALNSAVLVREEAKTQRPIYYVSHVLLEAEIRYRKIEKLALALVVTARKLRPYFQAHAIAVLTDQPLRKSLYSPSITGRMVSWAVELSEHNIEFRPRSAIKGQALADFLVECTQAKEAAEPEAEPNRKWVLFVDGSSTTARSGTGLVLKSPEEFTIHYVLRFAFPATNNEAEYEALIAGIKLAKAVITDDLVAHSDSQLIVNQVNGQYEAKEERMAMYLKEVRRLVTSFGTFTMVQIPCITQRAEPSWIDPIVVYLRDGHLPGDQAEARAVKRRAAKYTLQGGVLYKRAISWPLLKCLPPSRVEETLREVHEGICGGHIGGRALAYKVLRQGFYWPNMQRDAMKFVQRCFKCQVEARPLARIIEQAVEKFVRDDVIFRYGVPKVLVTENGQ
ncbi:uncharacterized protein LOC122086839 [Macadamia integrifolia]|uniref:uncharacterized protein LOC122086839 n=1 Tax=Macadamia integrifolia TaxID=60698 RepID=UPI001C4F1F24|nr:uncharacterized protein LOC122086839 [Macadamia integrifolia]